MVTSRSAQVSSRFAVLLFISCFIIALVSACSSAPAIPSDKIRMKKIENVIDQLGQ